MPPNLDIYVISKHRDRDSIARFLETWVDCETSNDRGDEELMLLPPGMSNEPDYLPEWEWDPAHTLGHIVQRGLDQPPRAFAVYLKPRNQTLSGVILAFTTDSRVVFGVSLDDADENAVNLANAKRILNTLARDFDADAGYVTCEEPPPFVATKIPPDCQRILFTWAPDEG